MIKRMIGSFILLCIISGNAYAGFAAHSIDGKYEAVFPAKPKFAGELGTGKFKSRSYYYVDEDNAIIYQATYQVGKMRFRERDTPKALKNYVRGQAISRGGSVKSCKIKKIRGNDSAIFHLTIRDEGVVARQYGVVSFKDGHFYQWSVSDTPPVSKADAEQIFHKCLDEFRVL